MDITGNHIEHGTCRSIAEYLVLLADAHNIELDQLNVADLSHFIFCADHDVPLDEAVDEWMKESIAKG